MLHQEFMQEYDRS